MLATVYIAMCKENDTLCNEAITSLNGLIEKHDTSATALKLRADLHLHLGEYEKASADLDKINLLNTTK